MKALDIIALLLLIVGGLNWLLVGLFEFDLVASIFGGQDAILSKVIYILVGLSALYCLKFFGMITDDAARHTAAEDTTHRTANEAPGNRPHAGETHNTADARTATDDHLRDRTDAGDAHAAKDSDDLTNRTDEDAFRDRRTEDTAAVRTDADDARMTNDPDDLTNRTDEEDIRNRRTDDTDRV